MAGFLLSPGVQVTEKDFTSIVPAVSTSVGAYAGAFQWGPVMDPVMVSSENELVQLFGRPNDGTAQSFFSAANFLGYANSLLVTRVATSGQRNAVDTKVGVVASVTVPTGQGGSGYTSAPTVVISAPNVAGGRQATAVATIDAGAVDTVTITDEGSGYTSATVTFTGGGASAPATGTVTVSANKGIKINNATAYQTSYENGAGIVGSFAAKYPGSIGNSLRVSMADSTSWAEWEYKDEFDAAPTGAEVHVIVVAETDIITGTAGEVLEKYAFLSKASDAKRSDGTASYYKAVINTSSKWVWWMDHPTGLNWGQTEKDSSGVARTFDALTTDYNVLLSGGEDDHSVTDDQKMNAYALYANAEVYDLSLVIAGKASVDVADFLISDIAETRKDCVVFISPENVSTKEVIVGTGGALATQIVAYRNELPSSSYAVMDSGYKYQYDRYNDVYRWVPLNADVAGLCARADFTDDPWFSPAGYNRGQVKNVVKLSFNPNQTERDTLYKAGVNSVVSFPGQGTVLYGDKTLLAKPSAFDRINVRRLFIVLEKAIATAAKYQLFEFNDQFTRAQFRSMVEPFLRDVQGRRGITDFRVKCDETNNTGQVIDSNRFVADIFIKPARSINFISLNFIAARTSVNFEEIGG